MIEKLGIEYVEPIEVQIDPNDVPEVVHAEVIGVELIYKSAIKDNEPGIKGRRRYDYLNLGYKIHLFVDFSSPVSGIESIEIESVVDDKGKELVKENSYSHPDYFSTDKTRVKFDVGLKLPSEGARSIKSVQGVIACVLLSKIEKAELGFIKLKDNAVSMDGDVKITYMHMLRNEGFIPEEEVSEEGQIHFEIANHGYKIHDIKLLDENGVELKAYMSCGVPMRSFGNKTQVTMEFGGVIPEVAQIAVERTKHFAQYELPFVIENISLLGKGQASHK